MVRQVPALLALTLLALALSACDSALATATPDIEATVSAAVAATATAEVDGQETTDVSPDVTATAPFPIPTLTPTSLPTASPTPTPTPTVTPTALPTATPTAMQFTQVATPTPLPAVAPVLPESMAADLENIREERRSLNQELSRIRSIINLSDLCIALRNLQELSSFYENVLIQGFLQRYSQWSDTPEYQEVLVYQTRSATSSEATQAVLEECA